MAEKIMTPVVSGFFGSKFKTDLPPNTKPKLIPVDIGGEADSPFRSAAAAMIENALAKSRGNQELAARLLAIHSKYFEPLPLQSRLMTQADGLAILLEPTAVRAKFINELAYALRQETVSEMLSKPGKYLLALTRDREVLPPAELRLQTTRLHQSAMEALAKVVQLPITIHEVEPNKEGQKLTTYGRGMGHPIALLRQGDSYYAMLGKPDYFAMVNRQRVDSVHPKAESLANDPAPAELAQAIAETVQQIVHEYEKTLKCLDTMLQAAELNKAYMMNAFKMSLNSEHRGQAKYAGIEHGSQHLFDTMLLARTTPVPAAVLSHEQQILNELARALARGVATGQVDSALIFDMEERPALAVR